LTTISLPSKLVWLIAAGPILLFVILGGFTVAHLLGKDVTASSFAIVFGAFIAWIAIVANVWIQRFQDRRQTTMLIIQNTKLDTVFQERSSIVYRLVPKWGEPISDSLLYQLGTADDVGLKDPEKRAAIMFLLNFYEDLAIAVFVGSVDENHLRRSMRNAIVSTVQTFAPYIESRRHDEISSIVWDRPANPRLWQHLIWLYDRFRDEDRPRAALGPDSPPPRSESQTTLRNPLDLLSRRKN